MSLFQCDKCGCCENTALSGLFKHGGPKLCSACDERIGKWHGIFERVFLPIGMFKTDRQGNLAHKETGDTDINKFALPMPKPTCTCDCHRPGVVMFHCVPCCDRCMEKF